METRWTPSGIEVAVRDFRPEDDEELFAGFARVVEAREGFLQEPPLTRAAYRKVWFGDSVAVVVARVGARLAGAYYLRPNFPGRAAHIANAGYFVDAGLRGAGIGTLLVEHSLRRAGEQGFRALMFNAVLASNPACRLYDRLGFRVVGRLPAGVEGDDLLVYWRDL